ncbi:long-chain-fatty-acid--CoA ligase 1-like [Corticium candelabrum]|uniref:long-chain-fatty-acid--CoA ligase 1-like n=1 Tax=Corticium candelabrum TaxID=121492 RepID=UPI002E265C44|nr:long-chain-fatty-acid--CoA ligase 1-like [Corticium candelabrum]
MSCNVIYQVFVYGNRQKAFVVGIVVPELNEFVRWATANHWDGDANELCSKKEVRLALLDLLTTKGKEASLKGFEMVKAVCICPEPFSVENGLLTPTLKKKRRDIERRFRDDIDRMYMYKETAGLQN